MPIYHYYFNRNGVRLVEHIIAKNPDIAARRFLAQHPGIAAADVLEIREQIDWFDHTQRWALSIFTGRAGLTTTFWVYGVLAVVVWMVALGALEPEPDSNLFKAFLLAMTLYFAAVFAGIWNAATTYTGAKKWAVLAKFYVVVVTVPAVIRFLKWAFSAGLGY